MNLRDLLDGQARGLSTAELAAELGVSSALVRRHLKRHALALVDGRKKGRKRPVVDWTKVVAHCVEHDCSTTEGAAHFGVSTSALRKHVQRLRGAPLRDPRAVVDWAAVLDEATVRELCAVEVGELAGVSESAARKAARAKGVQLRSRLGQIRDSEGQWTSIGHIHSGSKPHPFNDYAVRPEESIALIALDCGVELTVDLSVLPVLSAGRKIWRSSTGYASRIRPVDNANEFVHEALLALGGPPGPGQRCHFLDGDPSNLRLSNLVYGTAKQISEHARLSVANSSGVRNVHAKGGGWQAVVKHWGECHRGPFRDTVEEAAVDARKIRDRVWTHHEQLRCDPEGLGS